MPLAFQELCSMKFVYFMTVSHVLLLHTVENLGGMIKTYKWKKDVAESGRG
jgi:hypothetical protein